MEKKAHICLNVGFFYEWNKYLTDFKYASVEQLEIIEIGIGCNCLINSKNQYDDCCQKW